MTTENVELTEITVEPAKTITKTTKLLGAEWSSLNVSDKNNPDEVNTKKTSDIKQILANIFKIVLALTVILSTVMVSIGYLQPDKANNTIKMIADLHSIIKAPLEWKNVTTPS